MFSVALFHVIYGRRFLPSFHAEKSRRISCNHPEIIALNSSAESVHNKPQKSRAIVTDFNAADNERSRTVFFLLCVLKWSYPRRSLYVYARGSMKASNYFSVTVWWMFLPWLITGCLRIHFGAFPRSLRGVLWAFAGENRKKYEKSSHVTLIRFHIPWSPVFV